MNRNDSSDNFVTPLEQSKLIPTKGGNDWGESQKGQVTPFVYNPDRNGDTWGAPPIIEG